MDRQEIEVPVSITSAGIAEAAANSARAGVSVVATVIATVNIHALEEPNNIKTRGKLSPESGGNRQDRAFVPVQYQVLAMKIRLTVAKERIRAARTEESAASTQTQL